MAEREKLIIPPQYEGRNIYSFSRLQSFVNCEYGYYRTYMLKDRGKDNAYSHWGTIIHDIIENLVEGKIDKLQALEEFKFQQLQSEILDIKFPSEKIKNNFMESIELYISNFKPIKAKKVIIEKQFFTEVSNAILLGYIDAIVLTENDEIEIIDFKTSTKYNAKDLDSHGMQLTLYATAIEKEFGVKVKSVKWNMLRYCVVKWQGATKPREMFVERNNLISKIRSELVKDLKKEGKEDIEIELLLEQANMVNNLSLFSEEIQNKYIIEDGYVDYPYNEDTIKMLENFVAIVVPQIENRPAFENAWGGRLITPKDNFYCGNLCGHASKCKYFKQFVEENPDLYEKKAEDDEDLLKSLFG